MSPERGTSNNSAVVALIVGRVVYAVNWFSLAAVFSFVAFELNENVSGLGVATSAFFVGIGIFQVPGGIMAAKIGPRLTAILGTIVSSLAALMTGFPDDLATIVILRFFVGVGMALVFSPGVTLMARLLRKGSEGLGIGLYNSAYSLGAIIGLSGWSVLASFYGWRISLEIGGLLGLVTAIFIWLLVPKDDRRSEFSLQPHNLRLILLDRWLIVLSVALLSLQVGSTVFSNFIAYYLQSAIGLQAITSGTIASLVSIFALLSSPFAGRLFDRYSNTRRLLLGSGIIMIAGTGLAFFGTVLSAVVAGILIGLGSGMGFTFGFAAARAANRLDREYETLSVSWVNSLQLFGDFAPPLLYSFLVLQFSYSLAWLGMVILSLVFIAPLVLKKQL